MTPYYETELGKLYHGDCLEIMPHLEPVDLVLTDPWYYPKNQKTKNAFEDDVFWSKNKIWMKEATRTLKKTGHAFVCFSSQKMAKFEFMVAELSIPLKSRIVWHYRNAGGRCADKGQFGKTYEMVYHLGYGNQLNFPEKWGDERFDVWILAMPQSNFKDKKVHEFQKPISLFERIVKIGSFENNTVLDFFLGSGTTAIACERLNRRWIGIEIEEKYCEISAKRIEKERSQLKLFA